MKDSFYTPDYLADQLVSFIDYQDIRNIADFSVGEGELLKAAEKKWPKSIYYGSDINKGAIRKIRKHNPNWKLEVVDFLNDKEPSKSNDFVKSEKFDLVLLNPPFSCRGSKRYKIEFQGKIFLTSIAMYFVLRSLKYLRKDGKLYSILPLSSAYSEKDSQAWSYLRSKFNMKVICLPEKKHFKNCSAKIVMVSLNDDKAINTLLPSVQINHKIRITDVKRGNISMHQVKCFKKGLIPLVHTTNMINEKIFNTDQFLGITRSLIKGPALLIGRVGLPKKEKLVVISENETYIISDCIIALETNTFEDAIELRKNLIDNWNSFNSLYKGTGAKYITINKLKDYLNIEKSLSDQDIRSIKIA